MKQIIFMAVFFLGFFPMFGHAQTFSKLWTQVDDAEEKDHPRAAMMHLQSIIDLAERTNEHGQLMAAEFRYLSYLTQISSDSLPTGLDKLEKKRIGYQKTSPALSAVYSVLLGKIYKEKTSVNNAYAELGRQRTEEAFADLDLLARTKAEEYEPGVRKGVDSKLFDDDLLHVLGMEAGKYQLLCDYYTQHGNSAAACLMWKEVLEQQLRENRSDAERRRQIVKVDELIAQYGDIPAAGELALYRYDLMSALGKDYTAKQKVEYIDKSLARWKSWKRMEVLRNSRNSLTAPQYNIDIPSLTYTTETPVKLQVNSIRNLKQLQVTVYKTPLLGSEMGGFYRDDDYEKVKKKSTPIASMPVTRAYGQYADYLLLEDSIELGTLPVGVYLIEGRSSATTEQSQYTLLSVSNMALIRQDLPDQKVRYVAVDARTGEPIAKAHIRLDGTDLKAKKGSQIELLTDQHGEVVCDFQHFRMGDVYVWTEADKAFKERNDRASSIRDNRNETRFRTKIYTDRSIYRPGQTVHVGVITYTDRVDMTSEVSPAQRVDVSLRNANYKTVATQTVTTDEFGKASVDFVLPQDGLTGRFSIQAIAGQSNSIGIRVEEYKRPTFEVEFNQYGESYKAGDTIMVDGQARTYSGVPVQNAKVVVNAIRTEGRWWWSGSSDDEEIISGLTLTTDEEGHFKVPLPLVVPERFYDSDYQCFRFKVSADVTSLSGESHPAETSFPVSNRVTAFNLSIGDKMERSQLQPITFNYLNTQGEPIEGTVNYTIDGKPFTATANQRIEFPWKNIPSGRHRIEATCGTDKLTREFITFSITDQRPAFETNDWFYQSDSRFPNDGSPVIIQVGSSAKSQHVVYTIVAHNEVIEKSTFRLSNSNRNMKVRYKDSYGDGVVVSFAWVKDGKCYTHQARILRPVPERKLKMKWTTFRDKLIPGQKEEWTLNILTPEGTPAAAQLMATLYDKSLEQLYSHYWSLSPGLSPDLASYPWRMLSYSTSGIAAHQYFKYINAENLRFSHLDPDLTDLYGNSMVDYGRKLYRNKGAVLMSEPAPLMGAVSEMDAAGSAMLLEKAVPDEEEKPETSSGEVSPQIRENLQETAFFFPSLCTDDQGNVTLNFTLPESVTTWRFIGLAHDRQMRYSIIEDEAVAKKKVMVQPNMPRFLRTNDRATISTLVVNTSEEPIAGTAQLQLINPETEAVVFTQQVPFSVDREQTEVVQFNYQPTVQDQLYICRITAAGKDFSDGEQHYLLILPDKELVTNTYPITQIQPGTLEIDLNRLFAVKDETARLTVEYTDNPSWLLIQALPNIATPQTDNAISLATAFYANKLARFIAKSSPKIKETIQRWQQEKGEETSLMSSLEKNQELKSMILSETPWVADAEHETEQKHQLINLFDENFMNNRLNQSLTKLNDLRLSDGSWSWWKGMSGSYYITTAVVEMMTRLQKMIGKDSQVENLISTARPFLEQCLVDEMKDIIELERKGYKNIRPSSSAVRILYIDAISDTPLSKKAEEAKQFMLKRLRKIPRDYTIYGKATMAIIFSHNKETKKASDYMQSIEEYMVYKEEMGRYFDTHKAYYSWFDYRIPTQVHAIEAFQLLQPEKKQLIAEMQRWLLQAKRTQSWDTPLNAVDAIYAFFNGRTDQLESVGKLPAVLKIDGDTLPRSHPVAGLGYTKEKRTGNIGNTLTAEKTSEGISFGAVYAQFMQKTTDVAGAAAGLKVKREVLNSSQQLHVGDRIVVRVTIEADRDYDFVQVEDRRAACLEPVNQLSGYHWGYYIAPQDNATNYYFDRMRKGTHVIETEYYIDRAGDYTTGTCTAQCAYSPEFMGRQGALEFTIK